MRVKASLTNDLAAELTETCLFILAHLAYVRQVAKAVKPGGHVIVSTFGSDRPPEMQRFGRCSLTNEDCFKKFLCAWAAGRVDWR